MSESITIPAPEEIAARIRACREELAALRKLQRLARAAHAVEQAQSLKTSQTQVTGDREEGAPCG